MKFVVISDTHGLHRKLRLPKGDALIHGGDFSASRRDEKVPDFLNWFQKQRFKHKIFTAGNHDFFAANWPDKFKALVPKGIHFLNDSGVNIEGFNIWGSPVQPDMEGWAFGKRKGPEMKKHWYLIPKNTDILLTHTPPAGILDKSRSSTSLGCQELSIKLETLSLKAHLFGHVHASYGEITLKDTLYIYDSNYNSNHWLVNKPLRFELT